MRKPAHIWQQEAVDPKDLDTAEAALIATLDAEGDGDDQEILVRNLARVHIPSAPALQRLRAVRDDWFSGRGKSKPPRRPFP